MAKPTPVAKPADITDTAVEGILSILTDIMAYSPQQQMAITLLARVKFGLRFTTILDLCYVW